MDRDELAEYIEHTNLKAYASRMEIKKLCKEAKSYGFYGVCVNPYRVRDAREYLRGTDLKVISVVGFPLGATFTEVKLQEAIMAINSGADEIDMVMNIGAFKDGRYEFVEKEIGEIVEIAHPMNVKVKVIIETCYLRKEEIRKASEIVARANGDFVKTSTGFGSGGARVEDVRIIREVVEDKGIKAAGGIRDWKKAVEMIKAGANRIGTSHGVEIMESYEE